MEGSFSYRSGIVIVGEMVFNLNVLGILLIVSATTLAEEETRTTAAANSSQVIQIDFMTGHCIHCRAFIKYAKSELDSKTKRLQELEAIVNTYRNKSSGNKNDKEVDGRMVVLKMNLSATQNEIIELNYTIAQVKLTTILKQREIDDLKRKSDIAAKEFSIQKIYLRDSLYQCQAKVNLLNSQRSIVMEMAKRLKQRTEYLASNITACETARGNIERKSSSITSNLLNKMFTLFESYVTKGHNSISGGISVNEVYESKDAGSRWLVVLRRLNGSDDFNRPWEEYVEGFGDERNGFWYGLEKLYQLTNNKRHELLFEVIDRDNIKYFASYNNFKIGNAASKYKLESIGGHVGNINDFMQSRVGQAFSTSDSINSPRGTCLTNYKSGWWYADCDHINLTGNKLHCQPGQTSCLLWRRLDISAYPLKQLQMMIRSYSSEDE